MRSLPRSSAIFNEQKKAEHGKASREGEAAPQSKKIEFWSTYGPAPEKQGQEKETIGEHQCPRPPKMQ